MHSGIHRHVAIPSRIGRFLQVHPMCAREYDTTSADSSLCCMSFSLTPSSHFPVKLQAVLFFLALLALWLLGWQCRLASQNVQTEISIGLITMKSCTDIHSRQEMNPNGFGDPLTFPLAHQEVDICGQRVLIPSSSLSSVLSRTSLCALP